MELSQRGAAPGRLSKPPLASLSCRREANLTGRAKLAKKALLPFDPVDTAAFQSRIWLVQQGHDAASMARSFRWRSNGDLIADNSHGPNCDPEDWTASLASVVSSDTNVELI
jgi:hypothetical protein